MTTIINLKDRPDLLDDLTTTDQYNDIVRIDRGSKWGNPFRIGPDGTREVVIENYRQHLYNRLQTGELSVQSLASLDSKTLACWCVPKNCHGHVLAKAAAWATTTLQTTHQTPTQSNSPAPSVPTQTPTPPLKLTYAGIGSRETPPAVLNDMKTISQWLDRQGWHLHSGGAGGADTAFAQGARPEGRDIFLPWASYNHHQSDPRAHTLSPDQQKSALNIAAELHPAWHKCGNTTRQLHARNVAILLGPNLDTPVNAVICWTRGGELRGGTAMGIRIAQAHNIPVLNLATLSAREACQQLQQLKSQSQTLTPTPSKLTHTPTPQDTPQSLTQAWTDHHNTRARYYADSWDTPGYDTLIERTRALATTNQLPQPLKHALSTHDKLITAWQQRLHHIQTHWNQLTNRHNDVSPFYAAAYPNLQARIRNFSNAVNNAHVSQTEKAPYQQQLNTYLNHHHAVSAGLNEMTTLAKLTFTHIHAHTPTKQTAVPVDHPNYDEWKHRLKHADLINTDHPKYSQWQTRAERLIEANQTMLNNPSPDYRTHLNSTTLGARIQRAAAILETTLRTDQHHIHAQKTKQPTTESAAEPFLASLKQTRTKSRSISP